MTFQMPRATHEVPRHPLLWPPSRQRTPRHEREQAMRGAAYEALPPPPAPPKNWWEVLGVAPTSPPVVVDAAYRALAQQRHPDKPGGSTEAMQELSAAYAEARAREA